MPGEWRVTSQYIGGEKMYAVYRLRNEMPWITAATVNISEIIPPMKQQPKLLLKSLTRRHKMNSVEKLIEENEELRDELDDIVNTIGEILADIAAENAEFVCGQCIETAKALYGMIEEHGDENARTDILEMFAHKTGISLND